MSLVQPKPYMNNLPFRRKAMYKERRRNISKIILEKGTPLPKPVTYEDIDATFYEWVDKTLDIAYDGKRLPTYKLFSNQRISEYSQTWSNQDENGNLVLNFKTITRENNPKKGNMYGGMSAVPGDREYTMFFVPVLQENGAEAYEKYTMKLPTMVDFKYVVTVVTNKYELLNRMNELVQYQFKSINAYVFPNGHPMSMVLDEVGDESEYSIDDRKYYSQAYNITLRGYIILENYFKVTTVPSRFNIRGHYGNHYRKGKSPEALRKLETMKSYKNENGDIVNPNILIKQKMASSSNSLETLSLGNSCNTLPNPEVIDENWVDYEEEYVQPNCCPVDEEDNLYNKVLRVFIHFTDCDKEINFTIDNDMVIETFELSNVYDFKIVVNNELIDIEENNRLYDGDKITVKISKDDDFSNSDMTIIGYDPNVILDATNNPESALDDDESEEHIIIEKDDK